MKSLENLARREMKRKGQTLDLVTTTVISLMIFVFVVFAVLFGISSLNPGSFFAAGSANQNATNQLVSNTTTGIANFGNQIPTAFIVLGVVFILGFIGLLLLIVRRFAGQASGGAGSL